MKRRIFIYGKPLYENRLKERLEEEGYKVLLSPKQIDNLGSTSLTRLVARFKPSVFVNLGLLSGNIWEIGAKERQLLDLNLKRLISFWHLAELIKPRKVVNILSNSSYGEIKKGKLIEKNWWKGELFEKVWVVGMSSKINWVYSRLYKNSNITNLIVANLYGPGDSFDVKTSYAIGSLIAKIYRAKQDLADSVKTWGSGKEVRDFLYIDDWIEAICQSTDARTDDLPINVGTGRGISIADLANKIKNYLGWQGKIFFNGEFAGVLYKVMDLRRCQEVFGWKPKTYIDEGLAKTIGWYLANFKYE